MSNTEWLNGLRKGDSVVISAHGLTLATVTHATATQVHVNGSKFRRTNGKRISSDSWHYSSIVEPTPERLVEIRRAQTVARLGNVRWREMPDSLLFAVSDLVRQHLRDSGAKELDVHSQA